MEGVTQFQRREDETPAVGGHTRNPPEFQMPQGANPQLNDPTPGGPPHLINPPEEGEDRSPTTWYAEVSGFYTEFG